MASATSPGKEPNGAGSACWCHVPAWHWSRVDTTLSVLLVQMLLQQWNTPSSILELTGSYFFQFSGFRDPQCTGISNFNASELSFNIFLSPVFRERNRSPIFSELEKTNCTKF